VLTLVCLAAAFLLGLGVLLPLVPTLILMAMAPLVAVVGAILAGRAVARGLGRPREVLGLLAAGAAAAISVIVLLGMTDPVELEQQNACDVAYNTASWGR
jgi:hypothetical protein